MLSYLADFEQYWGPLRLFRYITFRALFGSATALVIGFMVAGPLFNRLRQFKLHQAFRDKAEVGNLADLHAITFLEDCFPMIPFPQAILMRAAPG